MIWIDYHNKFFDFKPLANEALLNKLIDEAVKTDEFRKFRYLNIDVFDDNGFPIHLWPLIQFSYDVNAPTNPVWLKDNIYCDPKEGYEIDFDTKKRIVKAPYFSFYVLKSLLHFKFKYNIPYYGTEFFSTPFLWIEKEFGFDNIYEKYKNKPKCEDYNKYSHIGKVAEISIIDDRLENLDFVYSDEDKQKRFGLLKKAVKNKYGVELLSDSEVRAKIADDDSDIFLEYDLTQEQYFAKREKFVAINPSDKFFRQFCVTFIARLIALDLGYFICKYNYGIYKFLQFNKVIRVTYTVNLFEFDIRTFSHPRAQETFKIIVKEVVKYLIEIFTNRAFINFEMDDFKFEYVDVEIFPGIKITDPLGKAFVIRFDFWNMNRRADSYGNIGYGSIKNNYENSYRNKVCGDDDIGNKFTFWDSTLLNIYGFRPHKIDFGKDEWFFWSDCEDDLLFSRFLGAYYHKEPVKFGYKFDNVEEDLSIMREYFENCLINYLENTGKFKYYFKLDSECPKVTKSWIYGRRNLSVNQVSYLDIPYPGNLSRLKSFFYASLDRDNEQAAKIREAREEFKEYHMKLFLEDNFYEFK